MCASLCASRVELKQVAVTGGSGRLGRHIVDRLAQDFSIKVLDLQPPIQTSIAFAKVNMLNLADLRRELQGMDAIVHLAAIDFDHNAKPEDYIKVNVQGTWNLLQAADELGIKRVILCSSISACGLSEANPSFIPHYLPVDEEHPEYPVQAYSVSKQLMERIAQSFVRRGMQVLCLRPMMVLLPENIKPTLERGKNPASRWLFYYISPQDCARAFAMALRAVHIDSGNFFITAQDSCRDEPTLSWLKRALGKLPEIRNPKLYADNPQASVFSGEKARQAFGFVASSRWQEIINTS